MPLEDPCSYGAFCVKPCFRCPTSDCEVRSIRLENRKRIWRQARMSASQSLALRKRGVVSKIVGQSACPTRLLQAGGPGDLTRSVQASCRNVAGQPSNCSGLRYSMRNLVVRTANKSDSGVDLKHGSYARYLARKTGGVLRQEQMPHIRNRTARIGQPRNRTGTSACTNPCGGVETTPQCGDHPLLQVANFNWIDDNGNMATMIGYSTGTGCVVTSPGGSCLRSCPPRLCGAPLVGIMASLSPSFPNSVIVLALGNLPEDCWDTIELTLQSTGQTAILHQSMIPTYAFFPTCNLTRWRLDAPSPFHAFLSSLNAGEIVALNIDNGGGIGSCCSTKCCDNRIPNIDDITVPDDDPGLNLTIFPFPGIIIGPNTEIAIINHGLVVNAFFSSTAATMHAQSLDAGRTWGTPTQFVAALSPPFGQYLSAASAGGKMYLTYSAGAGLDLYFVAQDIYGQWGTPASLGGFGQSNSLAAVLLTGGTALVSARIISGRLDVAYSSDEGKNWMSVPGGPTTPFDTVAMDAQTSAAGGVTAYLALWTQAASKSPNYAALEIWRVDIGPTGAGWTPRRDVTFDAPSTAIVSRPSVLVQGQNVYVCCYGPIPATQVADAGNLEFLSSSDEGKTWNQTTIESGLDATGMATYAMGIRSSIVFHNGTIYAGYSAAVPTAPTIQQQKIAGSTDGGLTWNRVVIPNSTAASSARASIIASSNAIFALSSGIELAFANALRGLGLSIATQKNLCNATGILGNNTQGVSTRCRKRCCAAAGLCVPPNCDDAPTGSIWLEQESIDAAGQITWCVFYKTDVNIGGFQFNFVPSGAAPTLAPGNADCAAAMAGFPVNIGIIPPFSVLSFNFTGASIPAGCGCLVKFVQAANTTPWGELDNIVFSDVNGNTIPMQFLPNCCFPADCNNAPENSITLMQVSQTGTTITYCVMYNTTHTNISTFEFTGATDPPLVAAAVLAMNVVVNPDMIFGPDPTCNNDWAVTTSSGSFLRLTQTLDSPTCPLPTGCHKFLIIALDVGPGQASWTHLTSVAFFDLDGNLLPMSYAAPCVPNTLVTNPGGGIIVGPGFPGAIVNPDIGLDAGAIANEIFGGFFALAGSDSPTADEPAENAIELIIEEPSFPPGVVEEEVGDDPTIVILDPETAAA